MQIHHHHNSDFTYPLATTETTSNLLLSFSFHRVDQRIITNRQFALHLTVPFYNIEEETEQYSCPASFVRKVILPCRTDPDITILLSLIVNGKIVESTELLCQQLVQAIGKTVAVRLRNDYVIQIHVWPHVEPTETQNNVLLTFGTRGISGRIRGVGECVASASVRGIDGRWVAFSRSSCGIINAEACGDFMPIPPCTRRLEESQGEIDPVIKVDAWRVKKGTHSLVGTAIIPVIELRNSQYGTCIAVIRDDGRRMGYVEIRKKILTTTGVEVVLDVMVNVTPVGLDGFSVIMKDNMNNIPPVPIIDCLWLNPRTPQLRLRRGGLWTIRAALRGIGPKRVNDIAIQLLSGQSTKRRATRQQLENDSEI